MSVFCLGANEDARVAAASCVCSAPAISHAHMDGEGERSVCRLEIRAISNGVAAASGGPNAAERKHLLRQIRGRKSAESRTNSPQQGEARRGEKHARGISGMSRARVIKCQLDFSTFGNDAEAS